MCGACEFYNALWVFSDVPCYGFGALATAYPLHLKYPLLLPPPPVSSPCTYVGLLHKLMAKRYPSSDDEKVYQPCFSHHPTPQTPSPTGPRSNEEESSSKCCLCSSPSFVLFRVEIIGVEKVLAQCGKSVIKKRAVHQPGALVCNRHFILSQSRGGDSSGYPEFEARQGLDGDAWLESDDLVLTNQFTVLQTPPPFTAFIASPDLSQQSHRINKSPNSPYKIPQNVIQAKRENHKAKDELWSYLESKFDTVDEVSSTLRELSIEKKLSIIEESNLPGYWTTMRKLYSYFKTPAKSRSFLVPFIATLQEYAVDISDNKLADNLGSDIRTIKNARAAANKVCKSALSFFVFGSLMVPNQISSVEDRQKYLKRVVQQPLHRD